MEDDYPRLVAFAKKHGYVMKMFSTEDWNVNKIQDQFQFPETLGTLPILLSPHKVSVDLTQIREEVRARKRWHKGTDKELDEASFQNISRDQQENVNLYFQTVRGKHFSDDKGGGKLHIHMAIFAPSHDVLNLYFKWWKYISKGSPYVETGRIYEWSKYHQCWDRADQTCTECLRENLYGIDAHFEALEKDLAMLESQEHMLKKMGLSSGLNIMLYGPPGTGKSSFVKCFARKHNFPIFSLKLEIVNSHKLIKALNPSENTDTSKYKIILVEDFDRYLTGDMGRETVSELLNALDGIYNGSNLIRIFSANHPEWVVQDNALKSRMRRMMCFGTQPPSVLCDYLRNLFGNQFSEEERKRFAEGVYEHRFSMRSVAQYLSRFLGEPNMSELALQNLSSWFTEMQALEEEEEKKEEKKKEEESSTDDEDYVPE